MDVRRVIAPPVTERSRMPSTGLAKASKPRRGMIVGRMQRGC